MTSPFLYAVNGIKGTFKIHEGWSSIAGVMPQGHDGDAKVARACQWIVLSDEDKKLGADAVIKEREVLCQ